MKKNIDPKISDNFQIGPDGAYEAEDDIFNTIEKDLHTEIPNRVKNWFKNKYILRLNKINDLVKKYPNDYDLGKNVRQLFNTNNDDDISIWDDTLLDGLDDE